MTIVMMQTPGFHEIKEFIGSLNAMYAFRRIYIQLSNNPIITLKYLYILHNNWKLDHLDKT